LGFPFVFLVEGQLLSQKQVSRLSKTFATGI
jgi:hypothetical protein